MSKYIKSIISVLVYLISAYAQLLFVFWIKAVIDLLRILTVTALNTLREVDYVKESEDINSELKELELKVYESLTNDDIERSLLVALVASFCSLYVGLPLCSILTLISFGFQISYISNIQKRYNLN